MPTLPNVRHERFARHYNKTGRASEAYRKAGYTPSKPECVWPSASRMLRHVHVKRRLRELKQEMVRRNDITVDTLLADVMHDRDLARRLEQPSTALAATQLAAKLCGLLVDKKELGQPGDFAGLQTPEEVMAFVERELGAATAKALSEALTRGESTQPGAEIVATHDDGDTIN